MSSGVNASKDYVERCGGENGKGRKIVYKRKIHCTLVIVQEYLPLAMCPCYCILDICDLFPSARSLVPVQHCEQILSSSDLR